MFKIKRHILSSLASLIAFTAASEKVVPIRYGNMEHWTIRHIKESAVIGGKEKTLYEIGMDSVINGNHPYHNLGGSPWGTSNVMAKVAGVVKTNCCVYPDKHKGGRCVKMTTHIESLKVLGLVNINVLAAGSIFLILQKRTEDSAGNITARRVGTLVVKYSKTTPAWVDNATYDILYGDITGSPKYDATMMGLRSIDYARNSKGENVPVKETGWAAPGETPTHLMIQFSSSHGGAFIGTPGNTLWIDNVRLVY